MDEKTFFTYAVPKKYALASLETCDLQSQSVIDFGRQWALNPTSLYLHGKFGPGKTHFAFAIIREMFRKYHRHLWPRFYTSPDLDSKLLAASKSEGGDEYVLKNTKTEDLLFIDDLGRETKSERLKRQYFEILNYRYANELPTILTSNFKLDELGEILDPAIASRIQEWQIIEFKGPDLRKVI